MKTWFDWMDNYYLPQPQPEEARPGETDRILALVRCKAGLPAEPNPRSARPRRLWALAAAAVLAVCLGTGTLASGVFPWKSVGDFFGADAQQQDHCQHDDDPSVLLLPVALDGRLDLLLALPIFVISACGGDVVPITGGVVFPGSGTAVFSVFVAVTAIEFHINYPLLWLRSQESASTDWLWGGRPRVLISSRVMVRPSSTAASRSSPDNRRSRSTPGKSRVGSI